MRFEALLERFERGSQPALDLVITIDDATSTIYSCVLGPRYAH